MNDGFSQDRLAAARPMYDIDMQRMSEEFFACWCAAGKHLNAQTDTGMLPWLRADPDPPYLEHMSFRLGNQLFFVRVEDADGRLQGPGTLRGLHEVAEGMGGHACVLPLKQERGGAWVPANPGWGLLNARTRTPVDPVAIVTDEPIEMTPWEVHDMAVMVVRNYLEEQGYRLMSWSGSPGVEPAIWFVGDSGGPEWVVVRTASFPAKHAERPSNWEAIAGKCARLSSIGHFASVLIASDEQSSRSEGQARLPLWRGRPMQVWFDGLE